MKRRESFARAVSLVWRSSRSAFVGTVVLFAISGVGMVALLLIGNTLLHELAHGDSADITARVWWLIGVAMAIAGILSFSGSAAAGLHKLLIERTHRYTNEVILRVTANARLREFDAPEFHDRLQRATHGGMEGVMPIVMALPQLLGALVGGIGIAAGLALVNPWLVPITLLASVPIWLAGKGNSEEMYSFSFGSTPNDRARFNIENIAKRRESAPEVRAFGIAPYLIDRWSQLYDERIDGVRVLVRTFIRRSAIGSAVGAAVLGAVLAVVLLFVRHGHMTLGSAATACVAVLLLANRSQQIATNLAQTVEHGLYLEDFHVLRELAERLPTPRPVDIAPFRKLTVDEISFTYPSASTKALDRVSFDISAGEVIAVVGHNGSGKTTLAKLLCGLYEPDAGSVRWDGQPLSGLTADGDLTQVGVVFQDFGRYWFSAADNIGIGDVGRITDRAAIANAAAKAGAGEFLGRLSQGFDTPLGVEVDGGADLSVGQWQRVAIARVLFRGASFLLLDEPTASLDAEAEAALFETIQGLRANRTVVLISHRFSTVRSADRILVLHEGRLVEQGDHAHLMRAGGRYARMYRAQSSAYVDA
ncbi:MAG TPA: ABC transporter ATP-binding protein [Mycobacteriales bacterium]|nr:ABC transporter ATP-binding protein [Mycobacteriales bacterium]